MGKPAWFLGLMREWGSEYVGEGPGLLWGFSPCVIPGEAPVAGDQYPAASTFWIHTGTLNSFWSERGLAGWGPGGMRDLRVDETKEGEESGAGWKPQGNADQMNREGPGTTCQMFAVWRSESRSSHPLPCLHPPNPNLHPHPPPCPGQDRLLRAGEDK